MNYNIKDLKIGSSSLKKLKDYDNLGTGISTIKIKDIKEVDGYPPEVVVYKLIDFDKDNVILEDTSFDIDGYSDVGIDIRWMIDEVNQNKKYNKLEACWTVILGFKKGREIVLFAGSVFGTIDQSKYNVNSFGFDSVFIPEGSVDSLYELNKKNKKYLFSARNIALKKVIDTEWDVSYNIDELEPWNGKYQK